MSKRKVDAEDYETYLKESRGLERDFLGELVSSRRTAWLVALGASVISLASIGGMLGVIAAHRSPPPPAVFTVDRSTGQVDVVTQLATSSIKTEWATDKQYINTYVLSREGYDYNSLQLFYDTTGLMSSENVQKEYYAMFAGKEGRQAKLGDGAVIDVSIKSIVEGPDSSATVRFTTTTRLRNGNVIGPANFIATLAYHYVGAPMAEKDRRIDALGFQITSYRVDPEVIGADIPVTLAGQTPAAPTQPATAATVQGVPSLVVPGAAPPATPSPSSH